MKNSGRPLYNLTWYINGWLQQKPGAWGLPGNTLVPEVFFRREETTRERKKWQEKTSDSRRCESHYHAMIAVNQHHEIDIKGSLGSVLPFNSSWSFCFVNGFLVSVDIIDIIYSRYHRHCHVLYGFFIDIQYLDFSFKSSEYSCICQRQTKEGQP